MYAWTLTGAATEEGEGRHDCTAVDNVHRQLFFMYILYFPLSFYGLCITRYFYRIHSTVDQTSQNNYVHISADLQCVVGSVTRTRRQSPKL